MPGPGYTPPITDTAATVLAQKQYSGMEEPVVTTLSTRVGSAQYSGMEPRVKKVKVVLRPITSEIAAQPMRPP